MSTIVRRCMSGAHFCRPMTNIVAKRHLSSPPSVSSFIGPAPSQPVLSRESGYALFTKSMAFHRRYEQGTVFSHAGRKYTQNTSSEWNKDLRARAIELIFGSRDYVEFTPAEKAIVDRYQEEISKVDGGVVMPNTGLDLEHIEAERRAYVAWKAQGVYVAWQRPQKKK